MYKPDYSLFAVLALIAMPAVQVAAQDDVVVGDDGPDAYLRSITDAAQPLRMQNQELEFTPSVELEEIPGITVDAAGNIYIFQRGAAADPIVVTDANGKVLRSFGRGLFRRPHSIRIDPTGNVWAVDSQTSMVYEFSPTGEKLLEISVGDIPDPDSPSCGAADVAVSIEGEVFIADGYCNSRIVVYDAAGQKIREWGSPGTGPGEFDLVHSIAIGPDGNVYVVDRENGRLQWFTTDGEYLGEWRSGGRLLGVAFSGQGELYLSVEPKGATPMEEGTVLRLDPHEGRVIGKLSVFGHEIAAGADGALLPATMTGSVVVYRP